MSLRIDFPLKPTRATAQQVETLVDRLGRLMAEIGNFLPQQWMAHDAWNRRLFAHRVISHYKPPSTPASNMCKLSCAFMAAVIPELSVSAGDCHDGRSGGMLDIDGRWQTHFWLVHQRAIIDPTASQFGYGSPGEILITARDDPRYNANLPKFEVNNIMRNCRMTVGQWLHAWESRPADETPADNHGGHQGQAPA